MPLIKESFIEALTDSLNIETVIGRYVKLDRAGSNYKGMSPFGNERTSSFLVSPSKNIWKDFSTGKGGSGFVSFVMQKESLSYPEAIEKIASMFGKPVEHEEVTQEMKQKIERKEELRSVLNSTYKKYQEALKNLPEEHPAIKELKRRGYDQDDIEEWGIAFAPENFLYDILKNSGRVEIGKDLGLIAGRDNKWDKYSNRVIYPINDKTGKLIGFAGRDITGSAKAAKWINPDVSQANLLYNKSAELFALDKAKSNIVKMGFATIVEGYNDVIAFHKYGLPNTVAPCGTAITSGQILAIKKYTDKVLFAMDPDKAGRASMVRYIPEFIKNGFRCEVMHLTADPDDYCRNLNTEGFFSEEKTLVDLINVPGQKFDGFKLLIEEYIQKDYLESKKSLEIEVALLDSMETSFKEEIEKLKSKESEQELRVHERNDELLAAEREHGKKSEEYKLANQTYISAKNELAKTKSLLKSFPVPEDLRKQRESVSKFKNDYQRLYISAEFSRSSGARQLCEVICHVQDKAFFEIYLGWIREESGVSNKVLTEWIRDIRSDQKIDELSSKDDRFFKIDYQLPKDVNIPLGELIDDINRYNMFMANSKIYFAKEADDDDVVTFYSVSNFEIEVLQHMNDEKFPMKLFRIKNIFGDEKVFDERSECLNQPQMFDNMVTGKGNFRFDGTAKDLKRLRTYLFDKMGIGKKIDVLGWQPDGKFWAWNNGIILENGEELEIDEHGKVVIDKVYYYIPSANSIYKNNLYKFDGQKRFEKMPNQIDFSLFLMQVKKVHRDHAISGILFAIASLFRDHIGNKLKRFPILFLYGPGGTGKDELAEIIQGFVGVPQTAINLEGDVSTTKASIRELAQFRNGISQFSEYKRGKKEHDGILKQIYDLRGYKRGTIESHVGTESVPVESSVILTGNDFPDAEALIQRLIWNEMTKNVFTREELLEFDKLKDWVADGISGYSNEILKHRKVFVENFEKKQRGWKGILKERFPDAKERMIANLSILSSCYEIFREIGFFKFPFSQEEMIDHFAVSIDQQLRKINSASILVRFFDCFISCLRGNPNDRIQVHRMVNMEGNKLYIQWTHSYAKVQMQWYKLYNESAPNKNTVLDEIKKHPGLFLESKTSYSFDSGRDAVRSSAIALNMSELTESMRNDIISSIMFQLNEGTVFHGTQAGSIDSAVTQQTALPMTGFAEDDDVNNSSNSDPDVPY